MSRLRGLAARLKSLARGGEADGALDDEIRLHLELETEKNIRAGMAPDEARRRALVDFGGVTQVREAHRENRGIPFLEQLARDTRYALRTLRRTPGFTAFTLLTFAVALGGLCVIFSLVNAVLLKPLAYPDSGRLVMVLESGLNPGDASGYTTAAPNYFDWQRQNTVFERMALYEYRGYNLTDGDEPRQVGGIRVSGGVFDVLRVPPMLGRGLLPSDDSLGNGAVVVLSHRLWEGRYGADSGIVGRTISINREPHQVIGVMPAGFGFPSMHQDVYLPINLNAEDAGRGSHSFWAIARLRNGISLAAARAELRAIGDRLAAEHPQNAGETVNVFPMSRLWLGDTRDTLRNLLVAVSLVLLIASANIASLLVARGNARRREIAARMALGGSRGRILRQLATESLMLALGGAGLGCLLAIAGIQALVALFPPGLRNVPFRDLSAVTLEPLVILVAVAAAIAAGIAAGLLPALSVLPAQPGELLRDGGEKGGTSRGGRLKGILVATEVALAVVVLAGAGLLVSSIARIQRVQPGLQADNVLIMDVELPQPDSYGPPQRTTFCHDVRREVGALPGIRAVSAVSHLPLSGANAGRSFVIEGAPDPGAANLPSASYGVVCPGYFTTMGIPLLAGRDFAAGDHAASPRVAVVNERFQQLYFPESGAVGRRIKLGRFESDGPWMTIIAVAGNVRHSGLRQPADPYLYMTYQQAAWPGMAVMTRTDGEPLAQTASVRAALRRAVPGEPVSDPVTMEQVLEGSLGHLRFPVVLFSIFGVIAAVLAALGCFGIASQAVVQRRRELAIRMALGAQARQVYRLVIGITMKPVAWGLAFGALGALFATRLLRNMLYGVEPGDPLVLLAGTSLLALATALACLLPARRAARVDPAGILRGD